MVYINWNLSKMNLNEHGPWIRCKNRCYSCDNTCIFYFWYIKSHKNSLNYDVITYHWRYCLHWPITIPKSHQKWFWLIRKKIAGGAHLLEKFCTTMKKSCSIQKYIAGWPLHGVAICTPENFVPPWDFALDPPLPSVIV